MVGCKCRTVVGFTWWEALYEERSTEVGGGTQTDNEGGVKREWWASGEEG